MIIHMSMKANEKLRKRNKWKFEGKIEETINETSTIHNPTRVPNTYTRHAISPLFAIRILSKGLLRKVEEENFTPLGGAENPLNTIDLHVPR